MRSLFALSVLICGVTVSSAADAKLKALIVDGQNNHAVWPKSTIMMKQYLEDTGLFTVDIQRTKFTWQGKREQAFLKYAGLAPSEDLGQSKADPDFAPDFSKYDLVVSNFGWNAADWPEKTREAFESFMQNGGGLVSVHAADNSFPKWKAYNRMIGLGGWGDRNEKDGPYVYYTDEGKLVRDMSKGRGGTHGAQLEIPVTVRVADHPITKGLPKHFLTTKDECYAKLRGPAEEMTVLATGEDAGRSDGKGRHEPILMAINYGKGRVFHTTLGHDTPALEGVAFITTFSRGSEWAATGKVTQALPKDFPTADQATRREFALRNTAPVSKSQQKWIEVYKKQKNVPAATDMLINTDREPDLRKGFKSLYNGKDLNNWIPRGGTCRFEAKGDAIVGTCVPGSPSTYLSTKKADYTDFVFTAELKWEVDGNTGIMFRAASKTSGKKETVFGPQAEMEAFSKERYWSGGIYGQSAGGWIYPMWLDAHEAARQSMKKAGWNRITIEARGDTIKTWLNGHPAAHWKTEEYKQGFFSLQIHSGKQGKVHFRNLKVKELK
jgi:type 1 glutamine amidotransferase